MQELNPIFEDFKTKFAWGVGQFWLVVLRVLLTIALVPLLLVYSLVTLLVYRSLTIYLPQNIFGHQVKPVVFKDEQSAIV